MIASRKPRPPLDFALRPTRLLFAPTDLGTHADLCDDPVAWLAPDDNSISGATCSSEGTTTKWVGSARELASGWGRLHVMSGPTPSSSILRTTHSSRRWVTEVSERGRR